MRPPPRGSAWICHCKYQQKRKGKIFYRRAVAGPGFSLCTLQEHQRILTNATVSKNSDFSVLIVVYEIIFFTFFKQISEINK